MCSGAAWLFSARHRHDSADMFQITGLVRKMFLRAIGELCAPLVARGEVSTLNDEARNDARKSRRLKRSRDSEVKEAARRLRGFRSQHFDDDGSLLCFKRDALAGHLFD